jgi:hypothetical protein
MESGKDPSKFLNANERAIRGPQDAEANIDFRIKQLRARGQQWEIVAGGTSRNVCIECATTLQDSGLIFGGAPDFGYRGSKTVFRQFWRP